MLNQMVMHVVPRSWEVSRTKCMNIINLHDNAKSEGVAYPHGRMNAPSRLLYNFHGVLCCVASPTSLGRAVRLDILTCDETAFL